MIRTYTVRGVFHGAFNLPVVHSYNLTVLVLNFIKKKLLNRGHSFTFRHLQAFAIFCGMGIDNTVMYEKVCEARAKQQVALECLSYHATACDTDVSKLKVGQGHCNMTSFEQMYEKCVQLNQYKCIIQIFRHFQL